MSIYRPPPGPAPQPTEVASHLPMLLIGLRWLLDTEQPPAALVSHHGQRLASAHNRVLKFIPDSDGGHALVVLEVDQIDWISYGCPRNPLGANELNDFAGLLGDLGEHAVAASARHQGISGSLRLATPPHPSLLAAVRRYSAGCPHHEGRLRCRCGWYDTGARQAITVHDLHRQVRQHDGRIPGHTAATAVLAALTDPTARETAIRPRHSGPPQIWAT